MALREDILNPISEDSPGGKSLRYAPVYDKIKEARREDDDAAQGEWQHERKVSDPSLVIKLASEAIASSSKDLQLAAWLTEALLKRDGYQGLSDGLLLIRNLVETFWDTLWPEMDDGDVEMRAAPIDWVGGYLAIPIKKVPLTKSGFDYLKYVEAKAVGREPVYEDSESKKEAYAEAVSEGKLTLDEFDKAVNGTPKEFYERTLHAIDSSLQNMEESQPLFEEKFGEYAPSYGRLRESLEEVRRVVNTIFNAKEDVDRPAEPSAHIDSFAGVSEPVEPSPVPPPTRRVTSIEPADLDDASLRIAAAARFWRQQDTYSPAPYLMLRGMRWGELRAAGETPDSTLFDAPSTETRTSLKRLLSEGSYAEVIEIGEAAMAQPCGRAWLDLQRYVVTACEYLGYSAIAIAIKSELKALTGDFPNLKTATLLDDTPCANADTLRWLEEFTAVPQVEDHSPVQEQPVWTAPSQPVALPQPDSASEETGPDPYDLAQQAAVAGRLDDAMDILATEIERQTSGRGRFERKLQLAQVCLASGQNEIARALLSELVEIIDEHRLERWESSELVAHALSLLYSCSDMDPDAKAKLYERICRISPTQALRHSSHAVAHYR